MSEQQMPARIWSSQDDGSLIGPGKYFRHAYVRADIAEHMASALQECLDVLDGKQVALGVYDRGESALSAFKDATQDTEARHE